MMSSGETTDPSNEIPVQPYIPKRYSYLERIAIVHYHKHRHGAKKNCPFWDETQW